MRHVERPAVPAGHVLVRIKAAGVARGTWLITRGWPLIARPAYGLRSPKELIAGLEFAGVVEDVAPDVPGVTLGDAVFGQHPGAFAELVAVPTTMLAQKPPNVSYAQAAATPVSGMAALQAVRDSGRVSKGQRVLVVGASGGVGSFAVQIAKAFGARVAGVASTPNLDRVRALGADEVIDYTCEQIDARGGHYDVVIDIAGNRSVSELRRVLVRRGTLVIVGGSGGRWTMGFERTIGAMLLNAVVTHRIVALLSSPNHNDLLTLADMMARGALTPLVQEPVPLERAPDAIERVGAGHGAGTLVVGL